jgi:hypothetical protein
MHNNAELKLINLHLLYHLFWAIAQVLELNIQLKF